MEGFISNIQINGLVAAVPTNAVVNFGDGYDPNTGGDPRLSRLTGVKSKRICSSQQTFSDLAFQSVETLLKTLDWQKSELSIILVVTQSSDLVYPGVACVLHGRLGLDHDCAAFDINLGCSGYPYALYTLSSMLLGAKGDKAILVVGDTAGKPPLVGEAGNSKILFGDCACATAISKSPGTPGMHFSLHTDGKKWDAISCRTPGGRPGVSENEYKYFIDNKGFVHLPHYSTLNGGDVTSFSLTEVPKAIKAALARRGLIIEDLDALVLHQANIAILKGIQRKVGASKCNVPLSLEEFGNTSSASVPLTLVTYLRSRTMQKLERILLCGFGVGLSWSTAIATISNEIPAIIIEI